MEFQYLTVVPNGAFSAPKILPSQLRRHSTLRSLTTVSAQFRETQPKALPHFSAESFLPLVLPVSCKNGSPPEIGKIYQFLGTFSMTLGGICKLRNNHGKTILGILIR
jgi:hypothetical protein